MLQELFEAYYAARKNKRNKPSQISFEFEHESKLIVLRDAIMTREYKPLPSIAFVNHKPVLREVFAAAFTDRVVHHYIFRHINPIFEKEFIEDSYSCRKGKGTLYGVKRVASFIKSCSNNYTQESYILKLDLKGYFYNIEKQLLYDIIEKTLKTQRALLKIDLETILNSADILVSTGGVSVDDYDFVKDIVPRLGAEVVFKGVGIKPGRHILVAQREEKFVLALPGFAYSSTVTAILYALPLVAKMLGKASSYKTVAAKLQEDFKKRSRFTEFTACNVVIEDGEYYVNFEGKKVGSSAILTNMLHNSALMLAGEEDKFLEAGTYVNVLLLEDF